MQQWEYITAQTDYADGTRPVIRTINGQEIKTWKKGAHLSAHLNELGTQGWEVAAVWPISGQLAIFILKRPVASA